MGTYTNLGQEIWEWDPFVALSLAGRNLWLALYTSRLAKLYPCGLFVGGVAVLAEAAKMSITDTCEALAELEHHRLIERDTQRSVIALTKLPDRHERPANGRCLKKWWNIFRGVPVCPVRDRWVHLLVWLVHPLTTDHAKWWDETFGSVMPLPIHVDPGSPNPQPVDKSVDKSQLGLSFSSLSEDREVSVYGISTSPDTVCHTVCDTVCDTVCHTHGGEGSGIRDQGSEIWGQGSEVRNQQPAGQIARLEVIPGGAGPLPADHRTAAVARARRPL